jgi:hypothetical protein
VLQAKLGRQQLSFTCKDIPAGSTAVNKNLSRRRPANPRRLEKKRERRAEWLERRKSSLQPGTLSTSQPKAAAAVTAEAETAAAEDTAAAATAAAATAAAATAATETAATVTAAVVSVAAADGMAATVAVSASPAQASAGPPRIAEKTTAPLTAAANSTQQQQVVQPLVASLAHITTTPAAKLPKTAPPEGAVRASECSSVVARRKNVHIPQLDGECSQSDSSFDLAYSNTLFNL